uniref:Uncharacterized protein n=1 Tax=Anguilla anguilla TaxID=7936 RepID=A0A0E9PPZ9_ANGAN
MQQLLPPQAPRPQETSLCRLQSCQS